MNDDTIKAPFRKTGAQMQILHLGARVVYFDEHGDFIRNRDGGCQPSFGSAYIGTGILPRDIVLTKLPTCAQMLKAMKNAA
jgi:hypothetical protein